MARPAFKPTTLMRRKVSIAAGGGMSHEEIALALGISRPTLGKHFAAELSVGAHQRRMEALVAMHRTATKGGNVAAQKAYLQLQPQIAAPPVEADKPAAPGKAAPVGKKEQAKVDATTAQDGTSWQTLLPTPGAVQ